MIVVKPDESAGQLAFNRAMRALGVHAPRRIGELRQIGKQLRALTGRTARR